MKAPAISFDKLAESLAERMDRNAGGAFGTSKEELWRALRDVCGIGNLSPKIHQFVDHIFDLAAQGKIIRVVVRAGRGTGKTYLVSAIELVLFAVLGWDWCNAGGSLGQASRAYRYISKWIEHPFVAPKIARSIQSLTESNDGSFIAVLAASQTSIRSIHIGGPFKGGGLVLDEEAEMGEEIVNGAKPIANTGNPSALIRLSTPHRQTGTFRELIEDPSAQGYTGFSWDVFDAMKRCTLECAACPVREFAEDTYTVDQQGNKVLKHKAFCGGRAHESNGHLSLDQLAQDFREVDLYTWMTEYMGLLTSRVGFVYDPMLLDAAVTQKDVELGKRFQWLDKALGIDWGYNETAIVAGFRGPQKHAFVYGCYVYNHEKSTTIIPDIVAICKRDNIRKIYADAAGAFQIADLEGALSAANLGVRVIPVPFGQEKDWGISNVTKLLETGSLHFLRSVNGKETNNFRRMMKDLKGYERDDNGKPKKVRDHIPDALLCLGKHFPQANEDPVPNITAAVYRGGRVFMGAEVMAATGSEDA